MTTLSEAFNAGVDAVLADNTLNRGGFVDAMQTVITDLSNVEGAAFIDELAIDLAALAVIDGDAYRDLRAEILVDGDRFKALFTALALRIESLPAAAPIVAAAQLQDLRDERDTIDDAIQRLNDLRDAEPNGTIGRLVKEVFRNGKDLLRQHKQQLRDQIQGITGDPDL